MLPQDTLQEAIQAHDASQLRLAIRQGAGINQPNKLGATPLMQCIRHHFRTGAAALVEAGADIHALDDTQSDALIWAAMEGESALVELLVDAGANVHRVDEDGESALSWAARNGLVPAVAKLLDAGVPIDWQTGPRRSTALMEAMKCQHLEVGLLLVERGANTRLSDAGGHQVWYYVFDHQIPCLRAAAQANEIARQTPTSGQGRGGGRL